MPRNIFGEVGGEGGLTNPLTEDLDVAGFELQDVDTLFVNEIEANSGSFIEIKNDLEMGGLRIMDLPNPLAGQEPVTLDYAESNFASRTSVPDEAPYDVYAAFGDETTTITAGLQPVIIPASRDFTLTNIRCFLTTPAGFANYTINDFRKNGVSIGVSPACVFTLPTATTSNLVSTTPTTIIQGDRFEIYCNFSGFATGLKVVFMGYVSI